MTEDEQRDDVDEREYEPPTVEDLDSDGPAVTAAGADSIQIG